MELTFAAIEISGTQLVLFGGVAGMVLLLRGATKGIEWMGPIIMATGAALTPNDNGGDFAAKAGRGGIQVSFRGTVSMLLVLGGILIAILPYLKASEKPAVSVGAFDGCIGGAQENGVRATELRVPYYSAATSSNVDPSAELTPEQITTEISESPHEAS